MKDKYNTVHMNPFLLLHMLLCNTLMEQNQIKKVSLPLSLNIF